VVRVGKRQGDCQLEEEGKERKGEREKTHPQTPLINHNLPSLQVHYMTHNLPRVNLNLVLSPRLSATPLTSLHNGSDEIGAGVGGGLAVVTGVEEEDFVFQRARGGSLMAGGGSRRRGGDETPDRTKLEAGEDGGVE
jgi:hypothetical protein